MNSKKQFYQQLFRSLGLISFVDWVLFLLQMVRRAPANLTTRRKHPDFVFPPLPLLYEIGGRINLADYMNEGALPSRFLVSHFCKFAPAPSSLLDWGCGVSCV